MVKAVELDIKLQKLANDTPLPLPPHVRDAMDSCILTAPTIQLFEQGTTSEFLEVGDLSCREISPVSSVSRLHMLPREKIETEIAYLEIVGRKDGRQRHCSDLA